MMNFIALTLSVAVAIVLASVISMVLMFALMCNTKFVAWVIKMYMKVLEKSMKNLNDAFENLDA